MEGKVQLPLFKKPPTVLDELLDNAGGERSKKFKTQIRSYNAMLAMTSMGGKVDTRVNDGRGPYIYRLNGQNHHRIGTLIPADGQNPHFAQLYFYDTENEVQNRMNALRSSQSNSNLDPSIVDTLVKMLDESNILVKLFRIARDRFKEGDIHHLRLRLIGSRSTDGREYNLPTSSEIAAIVVGDIGVENEHRDVIVEYKDGGLKRINELHPSYMALQYPLLFPYGEDGFRLGILYRNVNGRIHNTKDFITMREYYAYRLQEREGEGHTLIYGGRLFQQFDVDAYTCIEGARLMWVRRNQRRLRIELYSGLKDAVMRGDTTPASTGKRIVLPSSFTGSPRYMIENYQDAMAICRWAGYPDLFITFTCNAKWPEIRNFLSMNPGQKTEDRPDVVARVFKIKLDQLLYDLKHGRHFGRVIAGDYNLSSTSATKIYINLEIPEVERLLDKIQTEVEDATGSTTFILFDNGVEKIIPKTAKELAEMQDENLNDNNLPKELEKIIGKEYIFQLRLDEYNLKYGRENYTVSRIFDPDISEKNSTSNEAEIKKEIPIRCVGTSKSDNYYNNQKTYADKTMDEYSPVRLPINVENMQSDDDNMTIQRIQKRSKATQEKSSKNKKLRSAKNKEKC
uniref:Helitron helicase-like domain-containing protein n=1 Tax=Fagus sylvatica TaxID=28930 RepID=A0A2N9IB38_FAGSY